MLQFLAHALSFRGVKQLSTGTQMPYATYGSGPRVVCVHGTFHDLRCYEEHWLPYLASQGFEATAVSLRGTNAAEPCRVKLADHVGDLAAFLSDYGDAVVVAHSFGGPVLMELLRRAHNVKAAALFCSVPPSGNFAMTWRTIRRSLKAALVITRGFALKTAASDKQDARALFFAPDLDDDKLETYVGWFNDNRNVSLDLRDFQRNLPARFADQSGRAPFFGEIPLFVAGAQHDAIVDRTAVEETARFMGVEPLFLEGAYHDVMLGDDWRRPADALVDWIRQS